MVDLRFENYRIINNNKYGYVLYKTDLDSKDEIKEVIDSKGTSRLSQQVIGYYNTVGQSLEAIIDYRIKTGEKVIKSIPDLMQTTKELRQQLDNWIKSTELKA